MRIGVLGTGVVGTTIAGRLSVLGHDVLIFWGVVGSADFNIRVVR